MMFGCRVVPQRHSPAVSDVGPRLTGEVFPSDLVGLAGIPQTEFGMSREMRVFADGVDRGFVVCAGVDSEVRLLWCPQGVVHMIEMSFVGSSDVIVVLPKCRINVVEARVLHVVFGHFVVDLAQGCQERSRKKGFNSRIYIPWTPDSKTAYFDVIRG